MFSSKNNISGERSRTLASRPPRRSPGAVGCPPFLLSQVALPAARFADRLGRWGSSRRTPASSGHSTVPMASASRRSSKSSASSLAGSLCCSTSWKDAGWSSTDRPHNRLSYALHLTDAGREAWKQIVRVARQHRCLAPLDESERQQLAAYLRRIAEQQRLAPGMHPGWKLLGEGRSGKSWSRRLLRPRLVPRTRGVHDSSLWSDLMSIQIIGDGLGRTGTLSLKAALEELGFAKCYHMVEVFAQRQRADLGRRGTRRAGRLGPALRRLPGDRRRTRVACSIASC